MRTGMLSYTIRPCVDADHPAMLTIINEAAEAYRGAIPDDCWHDPYMSKADFERDIEAGVVFWGYEENGILIGIMGIQSVDDVDLIRHAYVRAGRQRSGVGAALIEYLQRINRKPILIGTWAAATWAIAFYERHGFSREPAERTPDLLRRYWKISERQVETSVVLAKA
jgi:GNAT superfamily N-acetyltransferase